MSTEVSKEQIKAGQTIFNEGDLDAHFYIVEDGQVGIFMQKDGLQVKIFECGPGESFGEFALLDNKAPRSATAVALTDVEVFRVTEKGFEELMAQLPDWAGCMLKNFVLRLKKMNVRLKELPQFIV